MDWKKEIENFIEKNKDFQNAEFERKLIKTDFEIKGLKTAIIEDYAKTLARANLTIDELLPLKSYDEILLVGFMLAHKKVDAQAKIKEFEKLLPYIDNWASCDAIISRLKSLKGEKEFFVNFLSSQNPITQRVGIIWLLKYNLNINLKETLFLIKNAKNDDYYVKMAKSWLIAEAFIYDFDYVLKYVLDEKDEFIKRKSIQKACESFRISDEKKEILRDLRKGN